MEPLSYSSFPTKSKVRNWEEGKENLAVRAPPGQEAPLPPSLAGRRDKALGHVVVSTRDRPSLSPTQPLEALRGLGGPPSQPSGNFPQDLTPDMVVAGTCLAVGGAKAGLCVCVSACVLTHTDVHHSLAQAWGKITFHQPLRKWLYCPRVLGQWVHYF